MAHKVNNTEYTHDEIADIKFDKPECSTSQHFTSTAVTTDPPMTRAGLQV